MTEHFHYDKMDEATLDALMEGCQLIDHKWRYLYLNKAAVGHSRFPSKDELIGCTMMEKYPGIEETEMFWHLKKCMEQRVVEQLENEFTYPDGSKSWFELRIYPVPKGIFILSVDITDRKKAEAFRHAHISNLEEIVDMTCHKLRQPVANLMGLSNALSDSNLSQEDLEKIRMQMQHSLHSLDRISKELVQFIEDCGLLLGPVGHNRKAKGD